MLLQPRRQEPGGDGEILVVAAREAFAVVLCVSQRGRALRDGVVRGQSGKTCGGDRCGVSAHLFAVWSTPGSRWLVSRDDGGLDLGAAVEHVAQHLLQAREWSFAGDVIR